jgi:hypothetical protein
MSSGIGIHRSVVISCFKHSCAIVLPRNSMREGPVSGSFGGGNGSGKSDTMLYHLVGNLSTDSAI